MSGGVALVREPARHPAAELGADLGFDLEHAGSLVELIRAALRVGLEGFEAHLHEVAAKVAGLFCADEDVLTVIDLQDHVTVELAVGGKSDDDVDDRAL